MISFLIKIILFPFRVLKVFLKIWILVAIVFGIAFLLKPLPEGFSFEGEFRTVDSTNVRFFADKTYLDDSGNRITEQEIFDEIFHMIESANQYVLVDMFLFNAYQGWQKEETRALAHELTSVLFTKRESNPHMNIVVITDPINSLYGVVPSVHIDTLRDGGVAVIETNLHALPDSNPLYSGFYRTGLRFIPESVFPNLLPHPFDPNGGKVPLVAYTRLLNFKANHRKVVVADDGYGGSAVLLTSANPHDGSSAHGNVAIRVNHVLTHDVMQSERRVAEISDESIPEFTVATGAIQEGPQVRLVTEEAIKDSLLMRIKSLEQGDRVDMAMFYLSDSKIVKALRKAGERGVVIRLILDPNKDAFGREKNGVPNRPVADILTSASENISVRWCETHGEQCHAKLTIIETGNTSYMSLGSANLTRRNVGGFNLESNIEIQGDVNTGAIADARSYFNDMWENRGGLYTTGYDTYEDDSLFKRMQYYVMEHLGVGSF